MSRMCRNVLAKCALFCLMTVTLIAPSNAQVWQSAVKTSGSSGQVFNYKEDCYILVAPQDAGSDLAQQRWIGAGKIDTTGKFFTGIMANASSSHSSTAFVLALLTGTAASNGGNTFHVHEAVWAGNSLSAYSVSSSSYTSNLRIVMTASLPVGLATKCYP